MSGQTSNSNPFQNCTLRASLRSPYARRVRIAFLEHGLSYHEVMEDVFQPSQDLLQANPLGRVPVATLLTGEQICESQQILNAAFGSRPAPSEAAISGLALGLCDKIVERLLESLRPAGHQDLEIFSDFERLLEPTLGSLQMHLDQAAAGSGSSLSQCLIDTGVALAYLNLRYNTQWQERHPRLVRLLQDLESRPSFKKTAPPQA